MEPSARTRGVAHEQGTLRVRLDRGVGLRPTGGGRTPDPYVVVKLRHATQQCQPVRATRIRSAPNLHPVRPSPPPSLA
eukprot:2351249-Prymnesium_polylepis.1